MMNENTNVNEMVVMTETASVTEVQKLKEAGSGSNNNFYCSIEDDGTRESKVAIYNAINNAKYKIDDFKGKEIPVTDIVAHPIELVDTETGEMNTILRVVLIDKDGNGYEAVSKGVISSIEKIFGIVGVAPYNPPLVVIPKEQKTSKGFKTLTLDLK